jgi:hypothetical protein
MKTAEKKPRTRKDKTPASPPPRPAGSVTAAELLGSRSSLVQRFRLAGDASATVWSGLEVAYSYRGQLRSVEISRLEGPAIGGTVQAQEIPADTFLFLA